MSRYDNLSPEACERRAEEMQTVADGASCEFTRQQFLMYAEYWRNRAISLRHQEEKASYIRSPIYHATMSALIHYPYSQRTRNLVARLIREAPRHQRGNIVYRVSFIGWPVKARPNGRYI